MEWARHMRRLNEKRTWSGRAGYIRLKALYNNPYSIHAACGSAYLRVHNIEEFKSAAWDILQSAAEKKYYYYCIGTVYYHYFSARVVYRGRIDEGVRFTKCQRVEGV